MSVYTQEFAEAAEEFAEAARKFLGFLGKDDYSSHSATYIPLGARGRVKVENTHSLGVVMNVRVEHRRAEDTKKPARIST